MSACARVCAASLAAKPRGMLQSWIFTFGYAPHHDWPGYEPEQGAGRGKAIFPPGEEGDQGTIDGVDDQEKLDHGFPPIFPQSRSKNRLLSE